jgi:FkbM family methyltransferase
MLGRINYLLFKFFSRFGMQSHFYKIHFQIKRIFHLRSKDFYAIKDFYKTQINSGDLIFDVGANIGRRTEVFLSLGAKVICFEPNPDLVELLKFRFKNNITVVNCGLGNEESVLKFHVGINNGISTFSEEFYLLEPAAYEKIIHVPVSRLDTVIKEYGVPSFCKIDAEGYDKFIIEGLSQKIGKISFEFHFPELFDDAILCISKLYDLGYTHFNMSIGEGLSMKYPIWLSSAALISEIEKMRTNGIMAYGDIYAK